MANRNLFVCSAFLLFFVQGLFAQVEIVWIGNSDTNWNNSSNWSPSTVPDASNLVRFIADRLNYPVLNSDQEVGEINMNIGNTDTINLAGFTLTVLGKVTVRGGVLAYGSLVAGSYDVEDATFTGAGLRKKAGGTSRFGGDLIFEDSVSIEMADTLPSLLYFGDQDGYNFTVNGKMTFFNSSSFSQTLYIARDSGLITFKDRVEFINPNTGASYIFGDKGGSVVLDAAGGFLDADLFISGNLVLRNITQDNLLPISITSPANLTIRQCNFSGPISASADNAITVIRDNVFNNSCNILADNIENLRYNTFNGPTRIQKISGGSADTWDGGNIFNDSTMIVNSSPDDLQTAFAFGDTFNYQAVFRRLSTGKLNLASGSMVTSVFKRDIDMISTLNAPNFGPGIALINGDTVQTIKGISTLDYPFDYITMQNDSGLVLNAPVLVGGNLQFVRGLIHSDTFNVLSFTTVGTYMGSSDSTYVTGPVQKRDMANMSSFIFPVGDTSYFAPIAVEQVMDNPTFTAQYFYMDPDSSGYDRSSIAIGDSIEHISKAEYWLLDKSSLGGSAYVTLYWADRSGGVTDPNELLVAHWDTTALGVWKSEGRGVVAGTNAAGSITTQDALTSFSPFTLSSGIPLPANPLPVNLLYFKAVARQDRTVLLNWATMQEQNNAWFEVERSKDGRQFEVIAQAPGAGTVYTLQNYEAADLHPYSGYSYYRLKQTDHDGRFTYSDVESVWVDGAAEAINVFPNPAGNWLKVQYHTQEAPGQITLYNQAGQPCPINTTLQADGALLHTESLPKGLYLLEVIHKGERRVFKVSIL